MRAAVHKPMTLAEFLAWEERLAEIYANVVTEEESMAAQRITDGQ